MQTSKLSITTSKPSKSGKSSTPSAKLTTEIKDDSVSHAVSILTPGSVLGPILIIFKNDADEGINL